MSSNAVEYVGFDIGLMRRVVDIIPSMLAYWDSDQRCRFANRAYERWFGVSPEMLVGMHIAELLGPLYQLNLPHIEGALRGEAQEFERMIPDPKGGPPRHSLANYIPDISGNVVNGFFVLVTDISQIKHTELALMDSEARLSSIIENSPDAIISVDEERRIVMFNPGAEQIFGYARSEVLGQPSEMLIPEQYRERHRSHVAGFAAGHQTARLMGEPDRSVFGLRKNGELFPVEATVSRSTLGGPSNTVILRDITERKRREREQRFLAGIGPVLAATLDCEETLTRIAELAVRDLADVCIVDIANESEVRRIRVTSRDPSKAELCEILMRIPLDRRRDHLMYKVLSARTTVVEQQPTDDVIASWAQSDEHLRTLRALDIQSMIAVPLIADTELLGAIALISTTSSHLFTPADVRLAEELAVRASVSLKNARLYQTAQRATKARDDVMSVVAHDLRSPLNGILLQADLLRSNEMNAPAFARESGDRIARSVRRMDRLIQDLLDVARMEAGRLLRDQVMVSLTVIATECVQAQARPAADASIELVLDLPEDPVQVWGDVDRLVQVFENLIVNAIKFTKAGKVTVGVRAQDTEALCWVSDSGIGIPSENLKLLFDRFWQAEKTERRGAGLGLPIVRGIVEAHGGRIWVESEVGRGTTFFCTLPRTPAAL